MSERTCTSAGRGQGFDSVPLGYLPLEHALSGSLGRPQQRRADKGRKPDVGKIVVCTMLSIEGYTEGPSSDVMAMPMFADAGDEGASVVVAVPAEGLHRGRAGAGPRGQGGAGRAPGGFPARVRAPVPADRPAMPTDRRVGLRGLGAALGGVLPPHPAARGAPGDA